MIGTDPYHFHPELRGKIKPADGSFFRDVDLAMIDARAAEAGFPAGWRTPCEEREAARRAWLQDHRGRDLWVFAYGSLMWDPALDFAEVRKAHCPGYQRSFCLWDEGARGSVDVPGLMMAIDKGGACGGIAFRITAENLERETFVLFRREMIAGDYIPTWLELDTAGGPVTALGFVADHKQERIKPGIALEDQARMIAGAEGFLGSNYDYLADTQAQLGVLGIKDEYVDELFSSVKRLRLAGA